MWFTVLALALLIPATIAAGYYFALTVLGLTTLSTGGRGAGGEGVDLKITVLIPAHNEELSLVETIHSVRATSNAIRIVVVADNCTDATETLARECGAECVVRNDTTNIGKGYALAFGLPVALCTRPEAVLILDADCTVSPDLFAALNQSLARGAEVVQVPVVSRMNRDSSVNYIAAVGTEIDNTVMTGWSRLGGSVPLRGTGMLLTRNVLERFPWSMHGLVEDAEYFALLRKKGIRVSLPAFGVVSTKPPVQTHELVAQRRRWRSALSVPGIGLAGSLLYSKPLVLCQLLCTTIVVLAFQIELWPWLITISLMQGAVYLRAMRRVGFRLPGFADVKVLSNLIWVSVEGFWRREQRWHRTARS